MSVNHPKKFLEPDQNAGVSSIVCEPDGQNAGITKIVCEPHGQNAGFFATCTVKMLEILIFCCNKWLSFWPVAHRNRLIWLVAILSWVFFRGTRGSSTWPGLESVAAVTGKTEICKTKRKILKIILDRILYCNFRWNDYNIRFAQNKVAVCNIKSRMVSQFMAIIHQAIGFEIVCCNP